MSHPESDPSNNEPVEEPQAEVLFSACNDTLEIQELQSPQTKNHVGWRLVDNVTNNASPINPDEIPELIAMFRSFYQYAVERDDLKAQAHAETDAFTLRDDGVLEVDLYDD
jgi:hypothetical protein